MSERPQETPEPIRTSPSGLPIVPPEGRARAATGPMPGSREEMHFFKRHSNWVNMVIAAAACFALVLVIVAMVPRSETGYERHIDAPAVAAAAQPEADFPLAVLDFGEAWRTNAASYGPRGEQDIEVWYQSIIGPEDSWVTIVQTDAATPAFLEVELEETSQLEPVRMAGLEWESYEGLRSPRVFFVNVSGEVTTILSMEGSSQNVERAAERVAESQTLD